MITRLKTLIYIASDSTEHKTLAACQCHELESLLIPVPPGELSATSAAALLVKKQEAVLDILSTTARSKPKARKINGGTKKRALRVDLVPGKVEE